MKSTIIAATCLLACVSAFAQTPLPDNVPTAIDATVGNRVLQVRYLTSSPIPGIGGNLDYGALLTENRQFIGSAALMFNTDIVPISRLKLQVGPQVSLALLDAQQKTDILALSLGASARYELISSLGLAAFGSAFYSPGVLTFGNAHNVYDFTVGAEAHLGGNLYFLGGYRWLKYTLVNESNVEVSNELFAGVRWHLP